jgi:hypothetical protein
MKFVRITDRRAAEVLACLMDETVSAVQQDEQMAAECAEVERLLEDVNRELAESLLAESAQLALDHRDPRPSRRNRRRTDRAVLRSLPHRLSPSGEATPGGEAA